MEIRKTWVGIGSALALGLFSLPAQAQLSPRATFSLNGDAITIGNTLGYDAAAGTPAPIVGNVGATGTNTTENAPDVYWQSDAPFAGSAQANTSIAPGEARSTSVLAVPSGSTVKYARLYWSGCVTPQAADTTVTLERPGFFSSSITADSTYLGINNAYLGTADVTSLVQANGSGDYRLGGMNMNSLTDLNNASIYAGWALTVVYEKSGEQYRKIDIVDGLDNMSNGNPLPTMTFSGFTYDPANDPRLTAFAFDGDQTATGDFLLVNGAPFADASNPLGNFFNGTRTFDGAPLSVAGDLPQLTGTAQSMGGIDLDTYNLNGLLAPAATSYTVGATTGPGTSADIVQFGLFVSSVPAVPEPACLALVAAAGLAAVRTRRRP